ncbi:MAG: DUF3617 family protein [Erythrobacter sp.]|nr:DUF3617 family protein [Erythrobacter sp.]NCQ62980.1 DUF3617 family protein [Alphaproteobacteria bacterium]
MRIAKGGVRASGLAVLLAVSLAGCGEPPGGEMGNEPQGGADGDVQIEPGLYRMQITLGGTGTNGPGSQFADDTACLTEEDVQGGHREMLLAMQGRDACRFERYDLQGSRLDAVLVCEADSFTPETRAEISGTVTPTASDLTMSVAGFGEGEAAGQGGVEMQVASERIGECPEEGGK